MGTCGSKAAPVTSGRSSTVDHSLGAYPTTPRASTSSTGNEIWRNASDLRTPPKDPNNPPSLDEVDKLVRGDGDQIALFVRTKSDDMLDGRFKEEQTIVYYLYGRRFGEESSRKERVGRILEFLKDTKTKQRMLNIVTLSNDKAKAMLEPVWSRCQMAVILFGNRPGAKTIFQDNKIPFVWRHQQSKNCFLQAVSSLLGYKVAQGNSEFCGTSGDVDQYVRDYYSNEDLYNRVVLNKGRSSTQVIEALVGWQSIASHNMRLSDRSNADFLVKEIDNLGPCTVCRFLTDSTFRAADDEGSCIDDWSYTTDDYHVESRACEIPQFDVRGGVDTVKNVSLGRPTEEDLIAFRKHHAAFKGYDVCEEDVSDETPKNLRSDFSYGHFHFRSDPASSTGSQDTGAADGGDHHAMLLIGYRIESNWRQEKRKVWFLVQNSWSKMPLCEMSADYLSKHTTGGYCFIHQPMTSFPDEMQPCKGLAYESSYCDGGDGKVELNDLDLEGSPL